MLKFEVENAAAGKEGGNVLVLLHGRGADRFDLLGLYRRLPQDFVLVAPEAPFPAAPWGYGPGWAWYRFLGRNKPDPETFSSSLDELQSFLAALPKTLGFQPGVIALGGFSQGGTLGIGCALDKPGSAQLIVNLSGFLADHPRVRATPETTRGTHFFWAHGRADQNIPFDLAIEGRTQLRNAQADLETHDYDIGHWIDAQELSDLSTWLAAHASVR